MAGEARLCRARRRARGGRIGVVAAGLAIAGGATATTVDAQDVAFSLPAPGRIVYTRQLADAFDMFTSDPDGADERRLSDINDSAAGEDQPRWSPDARHVAFVSYPSGLASIHLIGAEGGAVRTIVERDGTSGNPAWSPDGRCLVFDGGQGTSDDDQKRLDLKIWCDDGTAKGVVRALTRTPDIDEREADWSPDGATIVFAARSNRANTTERWKLWRIRPDGTGREIVVDLAGSHERQPRFSPDGRRLAFIASQQPFSFGTLAVLDLASGEVERYGDGASDTLTWSPDGGEILFANIFRGGLRPPAAATDGAPWLAAPLGAAGRAQGAAQQAGLYRLGLADRAFTRLRGAAGGADAPNDPNNFEFGYMPDWTAGTATPTPDATATPPPTNTPTASATPTATDEPTPTPARPRIYLPDVRREPPPEPTATPSATVDPAAPTPDPSAPAPTVAPGPSAEASASPAAPTAAATPAR